MQEDTIQPDEILARGALAGEALDDFGPVWSTAVMRLARASWHVTGLETFLQLEVPHTATSNGQLSDDAVEIVSQAFQDRTPENGLRFLELGSGSGLFAKLFLDRLKETAPQLYEACTYAVSDSAESILESQAKHGVLDDHEQHLETFVFDVAADWSDTLGSPFDAIFATYLLDSLPFEILAVNDTRTWQLEARSVHTGASPGNFDELKQALASDDLEKLRGFAEIGRSLSVQTRHSPLSRDDLPFADALPTRTEGETLPFVHCYGALQCLENCLGALAPGGIVIVSDYGTIAPREASDVIEFQSYGNSIANGVNFHQIDTYFSCRDDVELLRPEEEEGAIHSRVLCKPPAADLSAITDLLYGAVRYRAFTAPVEAAREMLRGRTYEMARKFYNKALRLQPRNWALMEEIASLLMLDSGDYANAFELADLALKMNPLAAGLWRVKGEALTSLKRHDEAETALECATRLNPGEVLAWTALTELYQQQDRHADALSAIARGFASDKEGDSRELLKELQERTLTAISRSEHDKLLTKVNRFRPLDDLPEA